MRLAHFSRLLLLLILVSVVPACSLFGEREAPETETLPVAELYQKAHTYMVDGNYDTAERYYQRLVARFPFGNYSEQAQLDLAYVLYQSNKPDDAYSAINRFIRTYPAQEHIDYAYYLRGLINFDRSSGISDRMFNRDKSRRDPGYIQKSFDDFSQLVRRFPDSRYAADARQRMIYLRNQLAQHELNVAYYYLDRKAFVGAANRAEYIIEHYQSSPQTADALAIMAKSYSALKLEDLAASAKNVLRKNYPQHVYLTDPTDWPEQPSVWWRLLPFTDNS